MIRQRFMFFILACLLPVHYCMGAETTRFVSDQLEITLRSGESNKHKIIRMLPSGTKLKVLSSNSKSGYSEVETSKGTHGFVLTRYLMSKPSSRYRLTVAEKKVTQLEIENTRLKEQNQISSTEVANLNSKNRQLTMANKKLNKDLSHIRKTAAGALKIDSNNKKLTEEVVTLNRNLQTLEQENTLLKDRSTNDRFMTGVFVLFGGIVFGLIIPRIRFRKQNSWGSI